MAQDKTVGIKVEVDSKQATKSLGDLENEFERLNEEIRKVPINSKEFQDLNKQIAQTGREVKNLELSMESLDNEQVASELGSVAGAVGDVSAAFILLGDDSETMQEVAKNIEFAMGLSMGLKGAIEGVSSANKLLTNSTLIQNAVEKASNFIKVGSAVTNAQLAASEAARGTATAGATVATSAATAGMKLFRLALIATGLGAIVVGLGLLIANFDKVTKAVKGAVNYILDLSTSFQNLGTSAKVLIGFLTFGIAPAISFIIEKAKEWGIVETREEQERKARQDQAVKDKRAETDAKIKLIEKEIEAAKKLTQEITEGLDFEIAKKKAAGKDYAKLEREKLNLIIETTKQQAALLAEQVKAEFEANLEIAKIRSKMGGLQAKVAKIFLDEVEALGGEQGALSMLLKSDEGLTELESTLKKASQDLEIFEIEQTKITIDAVKKRNEEEKKLYDENVIERAKRRKTANIELIEEEKNAYLDYMALIQKTAQEQQEAEDAAREEKRKKQAEDVQNAGDLVNSLSDLNNAMLEAQLEGANGNEKKMEEIRKKAFARDKALKIAQATITGIQAVQTALASPFPFNIALAAINGAAALANIVKIAKTQFQGSSGGGGSAPSSLGNTGRGANGANVGQVTNTTTTIGEPTKVYVTEQDISNTQNKVSVNEAQATI